MLYKVKVSLMCSPNRYQISERLTSRLCKACNCEISPACAARHDSQLTRELTPVAVCFCPSFEHLIQKLYEK